MRYPKGHKVSENVYQSLRFVTKVGVMTRATWYELFGTGSLRWKQKQLQHLLELQLFKQHPCAHVQDVMTIGEFGKKLLQEKNWICSPSVSAQFIEHDETVARGAWRLEQGGICKKWYTDKELKQLKEGYFKLNTKDISSKFPDVVMLIHGNEKLETMAVEYEKTSKSNWRYNKAIMAYSESTEFDRILYIIESKAIEESVRRAMRFIGDSYINRKISFIKASEWKKNPVAAMGGLMQKAA
jgi:hypothetical protein